MSIWVYITKEKQDLLLRIKEKWCQEEKNKQEKQEIANKENPVKTDYQSPQKPQMRNILDSLLNAQSKTHKKNDMVAWVHWHELKKVKPVSRKFEDSDCCNTCRNAYLNNPIRQNNMCRKKL